MFKFISFIENILEYIFDYLFNAIEGVVTFFGTASKAVVFLSTSLGSLPAFCRGALMTILTISILSVILSHFVDIG